jgi:hypothetical protein
MSSKLVIQADHRLDKLGDEYLKADTVQLTFQQLERVVALTVEGVEGVLYIENEDIKNLVMLID